MADFTFNVGAETRHIRAEQTNEGYTLRVDERVYHVQATQRANGQLNLVIDGAHHQVFVASGSNAHANMRRVWFDGRPWTLARVDERKRRPQGVTSQRTNILAATMPGQVRDLLIGPGDVVAAGAPLIILEAMKMEIRITAPAAGTITAINCVVGDVVERGQPLIEMDYCAKERA